MRKPLRREPGALFPRLYFGKLYLRARQPEKALGFLEVAAAKMPQKMDIQFELANAYSQAKQPEKAAQARQRFEKIRTDNDKMPLPHEALCGRPEERRTL